MMELDPKYCDVIRKRYAKFIEKGDDDETMIEFAGAIGTGNVIEAVGAKTLTVTHFIKVEITGVGIRYMPVGTIA